MKAKKLLFGWAIKFAEGFKEGWRNATAFYTISGKYKDHSKEILTDLQSGNYSAITQKYVDETKENKIGLDQWRRFMFQKLDWKEIGYATAGTLFFFRYGMITQMTSN